MESPSFGQGTWRGNRPDRRGAEYGGPVGARDDLEWLRSDHSLDELKSRFPAEWERARGRILTASEHGRDGVARLLGELAPTPVARDRAAALTDQVSSVVQRELIRRSLQSASDSAESGVEDGVIRLRRFDGLLLQRTLFAGGLVRKPVRPVAFRIAWRLAAQRSRLMPLVRRQGIYCFYSRPLVKALARLIGDAPALEIGAGDGTLARFLADAGAAVTATDDFSWAHRIHFPSWVEKADARTALRAHRPTVVLCSWPPANAEFETEVFRTPSVQRYVVVTSTDEREAGDWAAYRAQTAFEWHADPVLSAAVYPPGRNQVLVFTRR